MAFFEKKVGGGVKFTGRLVTVRDDEVELCDGRVSHREVVEHPGGVGIVPLTAEGGVIMVRQFRYPIGTELLEIPAGKLERGEDPLACAVRELSEETGCSAERMVPLGRMYPSPGYCQETLYLYLALGLVPGERHLDPGEFLDTETYPLEKLLAMADAGELPDAKTALGLLKAARWLAAGGEKA